MSCLSAKKYLLQIIMIVFNIKLVIQNMLTRLKTKVTRVINSNTGFFAACGFAINMNEI